MKHRMLKMAACLLAGALLLSGCGNTREPTEQPQETGESLSQVEISMPEYELSYSGQWKDQIRTEEILSENRAGLRFWVQLSTEEAPIFTLYYNSDEGELVTVLTDSQGNKIPVAFEMNTLPDNLDEDDANLFYAAQDAVNEIVESLVLK